jgi:hypothetical protein
VSKVKASIVCESHLWKGKVAKKSMNEDTKVIELHQHVVQFQPKFLVGTRKNAVNLRFSVAVRSDDAVHTIESDLSNPFIVITNECQWAEAEGTLIKKGMSHTRTTARAHARRGSHLRICCSRRGVWRPPGDSLGAVRQRVPHALHPSHAAGRQQASACLPRRRFRVPARQVFRQQADGLLQGL